MEVFQKLGAAVEQLWRDKNYSEDLFPAIAAEALEDFNLPEKISAWDTISWALGEHYLPEQRDLAGRFGDPPITLYNSPRFHIDIYFWLNGTTSIHQHAFCGAFQVLLGSSIHSHYDFETREIVNRFTEIGDINLEECELLSVGDVREIRAGREFIHALFHLDQPSATIVVRTHRSPLHLPQFDYRKPFLAVDPFFEEPTLAKKLQTISMVLRANHPEADQMTARLLEHADFQTAYTILSNIRHLLNEDVLKQMFQVAPIESRYEKLFEIVRKKHGSLADALPKIFAEERKIGEIVNRRAFITNPELRFFLALLMNVEGRERIFALVKMRFPEADALEKILDWVAELAQTKIVGTNLPNALGIEGFDDFYLFVLEDLINGVSVEEMRENLESQTSAESFGRQSDDLDKRIVKIKESAILQPLLSIAG